MISRRARIVALWSVGILAALWVVVHARYITDLSAFLPARPTPMQKLLVDQLRDGPASRLILIALERGDAGTRATLSMAMAQRLRQDPAFSNVENGEPLDAERDRAFLFEHRYLLSDQISAQHFSPAGLQASIADTIDELSSSTGLMLKSLVPHDPTGETLHILDRMAHGQGPQTQDGVWVSADGARTLLVAETAAAGSDTDAQEHALDAIRQAFTAAVTARPAVAATPATAPAATSSPPSVAVPPTPIGATATPPVAVPATPATAPAGTSSPPSVAVPPTPIGATATPPVAVPGARVAPSVTATPVDVPPTPAGIAAAPRTSTATTPPAEVRLRLSGPGVFAVAARAKIKRAATRLSIVSSILVVAVLLTVYRSIPALVLGLLPVASGALVGIAAVALGFGVIHGITLGFGITLIGESVDYSIYFFIQSLQANAAGSGSANWQRMLWPTIRLGMLTSVCGFASLLPSGFPGLAQLGLYSISGLIAAALVTRFVLPELLPRGFEIRDVRPLGMCIGRLRDAMRAHRRAIAIGSYLIAGAALLVLYRHHQTLWNRELSSLSPISLEEQRYDATLRADLGAADVLDLIVVSGADLETVLQGAERVSDTLRPLVDADVVGDVDSPANYLPSLKSQRARRDALPERRVLQDNLRLATRDLNLQEDQLAPFVDDVDAARRAPLVTAEDLRGTSLATGFASLILRQSGRWSALLPLHAPKGLATPAIDIARVAGALTAARLEGTSVLDMKAQTDALYADYLHEAMRLSLGGFALIVLLLLGTLRSPLRTARVLAPLVLAVLVVASALVICKVQFTILHLVGMLLIVAVGSNYALFFDEEGTHATNANSPLTLASLGIANLSTVIGFGLLSFSQVPVLEALGTTVAPGALLALVFAALITSRARIHA